MQLLLSIRILNDVEKSYAILSEKNRPQKRMSTVIPFLE